MVIWSEPAKIDLHQIFDYISQDSEYYAREVIDKIIVEVEKLIDFPEMGRVVPELTNKKIREIIIYSYRIVYEISENIEILAIIHARQDFETKMNQ